MSRKRRKAALIAGCDWFILNAVRETLRSVTSKQNTLKR